MVDLILIGDILLFSIAFLWLLIASFIDIKKREIPNWISYSLIAIALALRALLSLITRHYYYFFYALIAFIIFFALANLFYYTRVFGGGDAKLLIALSVLFATTPSFATNIFSHITQESFFYLSYQSYQPFLLTFLINIFVLGSLYGLFFSIFSSIKNKKKFTKEFKKINRKVNLFKVLCWFTAFIFLIFIFFDQEWNWFFMLFIIFLVLPYLYIFIRAAEDSAMIRKVSPQKLTEGDWILNSIKIKDKIIKPSVYGLTKKEISLLKKRKKLVTVKYGLPFIPIFLLSLIISLFSGNLLFLIIQIFI